MAPRQSEDEFRNLIRMMVADGRYPDHRAVRNALGTRNHGPQLRSGLTQEQTRWRTEEVERAGYDWAASKAARRLVAKPS